MNVINQFLMIAAFFGTVHLQIYQFSQIISNYQYNTVDYGTCNLKDGSRGRCKVINECDWVRKKFLQSQLSDLAACGPIYRTDMYCCPQPTTVSRARKSKSEKYCDEIKEMVSNQVKVPMGSRIFNGETAQKGEFPHMVAIGFKTTVRGQSFTIWGCGGSLITDSFVLTAAHCLSRTLKVVKMGMNDLTDRKAQEIDVKRQIKHPLYTTNRLYNDIALLELDGSADFSGGLVRPICLPTSTTRSASNEYSIAGWGFVEYTSRTNQLQKAVNSEISQMQCRMEIPPSEDLRNGVINTQICAKNTATYSDTCQGDSGGPFFFKENGIFYVYGVTSFGLDKNCSVGDGSAGVYTRVSSYLDWIESEVWN